MGETTAETVETAEPRETAALAPVAVLASRGAISYRFRTLH